MKYFSTILLFLICFTLPNSVSSANNLTPWPLPPWQSANLSLGKLHNSFSNNLSGCHWNAQQKELYLVINKPGRLIRLTFKNQTFILTGDYKIKGDIEGVTQIPGSHDVFVIDEKKSIIRRLSLSGTNYVSTIRSWELEHFLPNRKRLGMEGVTFIPRQDTPKAFNAFLYPESEGVFIVAHQNGGELFVFDLSREKAKLLQKITTRAQESSGLEYESETKQLYIWHNTGKNSLEIVTPQLVVGSSDSLPLKQHFIAPKTGNIESVAVGKLGTNYSLFFTDDDNQDNIPIIWYKNWSPPM